MASNTDTTQDVRSAKPARGLRVEAWTFMFLTAFFILAAIVYGILTVPVEPVGVVALALTGGLSGIIGTFLLFTGRRLEGPRPEDDDYAEVSDGAGELGFFSPGSYWPFAIAAAAAFLAIAVAFWLVWLVTIATVFLIMAIAGLLFEYHKGPAKH